MKKKRFLDQRLNITFITPNNAKQMPVSFSIHKRSIVLCVVLSCVLFVAGVYFTFSALLKSNAPDLEKAEIQRRDQLIAGLEQDNNELEGTIQSQNKKAQLHDFYVKKLEQSTRDLSDKLNKLLAGKTEADVSTKSPSESGRTLLLDNFTFGSGSINGGVELLNWIEGSKLFPQKTVATVIDVDTGRSFQVLRNGGSYHADCEPLTATDTTIMKDICGGRWTWDRRAIWVKVDDRYFAASMHAMPHKDDVVPGNNFVGHFCIHFPHSKLHFNTAECPVHQAMVQKAFINASLLKEYLITNQYE